MCDLTLQMVAIHTLDSSKSSLQDSLESNIAFSSQGFKKVKVIDKKDLDCHEY
ncbi:hypothetical protein [Helicobacter sp. T3_23-1056]